MFAFANLRGHPCGVPRSGHVLLSSPFAQPDREYWLGVHAQVHSGGAGHGGVSLFASPPLILGMISPVPGDVNDHQHSDKNYQEQARIHRSPFGLVCLSGTGAPALRRLARAFW